MFEEPRLFVPAIVLRARGRSSSLDELIGAESVLLVGVRSRRFTGSIRTEWTFDATKIGALINNTN